MGIVFRPARSADAAGLVGLVEELGYPAPTAAVAERLARLLERVDQAVFLAEEEGEIRGWIHVQEFHALASDPTGLVTGLVVDRAARRRGLGRALMGMAEDWARARGLASLRLRARAARTDAHAFYRGLGYELAKRQLQFRKEL
jgi:ribosomal protein S18 acetylase RimI-like enzyme